MIPSSLRLIALNRDGSGQRTVRITTDQATLDDLTQKPGELETSSSPDKALVSWLREAVAFVHGYNGVVDIIAAALRTMSRLFMLPASTCVPQACVYFAVLQAEELARADIDGTDLFSLIGGLGWLGDQPSLRRAPIISSTSSSV